MASILYKWFLVASLSLFYGTPSVHPIYVSVVEIEHNAKDKTLEISCKIFTDDLEKTLRKAYNVHVDLLDPKEKEAMSKLLNDYVQKHLKISLEGKNASLRFLGYEQIEEGIYSYYQADNVNTVKSISITDDILYEYKTEQMGLIHVTVNGNRKSTKLNNPDGKASFVY
ncbi:MAG: DUF6702 family protein [Ferruginibacter sp.]